MSDFADTLKDDLRACVKEAQTLGPLTTTSELISHIKNTLWPMVERVVEVAEDEFEATYDYVDEQASPGGEVLSRESAGLFSGIIMGGLTLVAKMREWSPKGKDQLLDKALEEYEQKCHEGMNLLRDLVDDGSEQHENGERDPDDFDPDEPDDDEDDDDDEEGDDDEH